MNSSVLSTFEFQQCPALNTVAFTLPLIKKLEFENLENLGTITLICRGLETLAFNGCPRIRDNTLTQLVSNCKHLQGLGMLVDFVIILVVVRNCVGVTQNGVAALTHLQHLVLQELHNVDELEFESKTLTSLTLIDVPFTDALLQCPSLTKVTMERSPKSDCAFRHVTKPAKGSHLFPSKY